MDTTFRRRVEIRHQLDQLEAELAEARARLKTLTAIAESAVQRTERRQP